MTTQPIPKCNSDAAAYETELVQWGKQGWERAAELEVALGLCLDDLESFPRSLGMNFTKGAKEAKRILNR